MSFANAGIPVIVKETTQEALDRGMATIRKNYANTVKKGKMTQAAMDERLARITPQLTYDGFDQADIIAEAVFEGMTLKKQVFAEIDGIAKPGCIFASNTSYLDIDEIASVTRAHRGRLRILASEKNAADYERIASLVDGDAYYWSSVNPQTYPGFQKKLSDMGAAVHRHGGMWIPSAAPGFDARLIGGTRIVPRNDGRTLQTQMAAATAAQPDVIGLISWNEFSENSYVEPSRKYGTRYLEVLAGINGRQVKLATDIDSADPSNGGAGWQVPLLGLLAIGVGGTLLSLRKRENARQKRGARV